MRIIRDLQQLEKPPGACVVTIGNFDGMHLGHQQLLKGVCETAKSLGAVAAAVTFEPHPLKLLAPASAPRLLTRLEQKTRLIEREGIELLVVLSFTEQLARLSPSEFVQTVLQDKLHALSVHVGSGFRFGHRRAGDVKILRELARGAGFKVEVLPTLECHGERVSSSRVRELLAEGHVHHAGRLLARPYAIGGPVVSGLGVGKKQTVPTLNLAPVEEQLPKTGVYVTRTRLGDGLHDSVSNVGYKPTWGEHRLTVESFLLNFAGEIHEPEMEVQFLHRLRDEKKFPDAAALKAQILRDAQRSTRFFHLLKLLQRPQPRGLVPAAGLVSRNP